MRGVPAELTGRRFGRLTVLRQVARAAAASHWLTSCDCGTQKVVRVDALTTGTQVSCGCHRRERIKLAVTSHGMSSRSEHHIWRQMLGRCCNPKNRAWKDYGGRGITVCDRWRYGEGGQGGFELFIKDVGFRPSPDMSIDRIENDKGYDPGNVRWATRVTQSNNRRSNRLVTYHGARLTLIEAVRAAGSLVTASAATYRLSRGWSVEDAVEAPGRRSLH